MGRAGAWFNILIVLADRDLHGYAIMQEVERLTGTADPPGPTTLYRTIRQLLEDGLIVEIDPPADEEDERRRYYRITSAGRRAAVAEMDRLEQLVQLARSKRGLRRRTA
jgi:DNA-binding PadR family transcriptional regulator